MGISHEKLLSHTTTFKNLIFFYNTIKSFITNTNDAPNDDCLHTLVRQFEIGEVDFEKALLMNI